MGVESGAAPEGAAPGRQKGGNRKGYGCLPPPSLLPPGAPLVSIDAVPSVIIMVFSSSDVCVPMTEWRLFRIGPRKHERTGRDGEYP